MKLQGFDLNYFLGKSHFEDDGTQNYLVFQPVIRLLMLVKLQHGNQNDYLMRLFNLYRRLIIVLIQE